jgi:hypothetical protein
LYKMPQEFCGNTSQFVFDIVLLLDGATLPLSRRHPYLYGALIPRSPPNSVIFKIRFPRFGRAKN